MKEIILTKEIAPIQTKDRTLAVTPNLVFTTAKQFNRIFVEKESKISFDLNNFSEGKGENAKHFKFNLTLEQFYGIVEALRSGYILFAKTKIEHFADYSMFPPEKDGVHKGEYKFRKFTLEYKNGKDYPFCITITNAYKDKQGNFTSSEYAYINLSFDTFASLLNNIENVIKIHLDLYANSGRVQEGYKLLAESEKNRTKDTPTSTQQTETPNTVPTTPIEQPVQNEQPVQSTQPITEQQTNSTASTKSEIHAIEGIFVSDFQALSNAYVAKFRMENGREYDIHFQEVPDELRTAKEIESRVMINIYAYGDMIIFDSLV